MKKAKLSNTLILCISFAAMAIGFNSPYVSAADENAIAQKETSSFDRIWSFATLYKNEDNTVLQKLAFSGRYQGRYYWTEGDTGEEHDWENRRLRLGFRGIFARQFSFRVEADFDTDADPWYTGLTEAYVDWKPTEEFHLPLERSRSSTPRKVLQVRITF